MLKDLKQCKQCKEYFLESEMFDDLCQFCFYSEKYNKYLNLFKIQKEEIDVFVEQTKKRIKD